MYNGMGGISREMKCLQQKGLMFHTQHRFNGRFNSLYQSCHITMYKSRNKTFAPHHLDSNS